MAKLTMNRQNRLTPADKTVIIGCVISFILIPIIGPFIYLFIADLFARSERKLRILSALDAETSKSKELSAKLENTLTTIKHLKQKIASYENRASAHEQ